MSAKPITVLCSDEALLVQEHVDAWRAHARMAGFSEREVFSVEGHFNWAAVLDAQRSLSLFGDKKIIELRIPTGKPGKEGGEAIKSMCAQLSDDVAIMVTLPRMDKTSKNSVWFKQLSQHATPIDIGTIGEAQLPRWLSERLKQQNQSASPAALQLMAQQFEGNLVAAHQEILKLALLFPEGLISDDDIRNSIFNVARYDVFSLSESLLTGDVARVCRMIEGLQAEGESIVLVLWSLTEDVRAMTRLKSDMDNGGHLPSLMREQRIWGPREKLMPNALRALSSTFLKNALQRTADLDRMAKGLSKGNPWEATLQLASQIALRISKTTAK